MGGVNLFNTGKSGLFSNRAGLSTTGHNIANVNTEGYSRQRIENEATVPAYMGSLVLGTGTKTGKIQRVNDEYLTRQIAKEAKAQGNYEEQDMALAQAEVIFNEINGEGMNRIMSRFFNEFRKLGNEPESDALRATVKEAGQQVVGDFHRMSSSLREVRKGIDVRLNAHVGEVNELVQRIAKLNEEIRVYEVRGGQPGDFQDARDLAIKRLSTIADVSISNNERGELTINLAGAGPLLSGSLFNKLYTETTKADFASGVAEGSTRIYLERVGLADVTHRLKGGRLGGLIEARDKILGGISNRIDEMAHTFASKLNEIHRMGYSMRNTSNINFFEPLNGIQGAAELIELNHTIAADPGHIATALSPNSPGDNRLVQMITNLQHQRLMGGGQATLDDHFNAAVADMAAHNQKNRQLLEHQSHIVGQLDKLRESISGVSLDEETTNLVQYQHAFDASARVIKMADEMLDTVLNLRRI